MKLGLKPQVKLKLVMVHLFRVIIFYKKNASDTEDFAKEFVVEVTEEYKSVAKEMVETYVVGYPSNLLLIYVAIISSSCPLQLTRRNSPAIPETKCAIVLDV